MLKYKDLSRPQKIASLLFFLLLIGVGFFIVLAPRQIKVAQTVICGKYGSPQVVIGKPRQIDAGGSVTIVRMDDGYTMVVAGQPPSIYMDEVGVFQLNETGEVVVYAPAPKAYNPCVQVTPTPAAVRPTAIPIPR